jgi:flagellar hook-length control protein FliK
VKPQIIGMDIQTAMGMAGRSKGKDGRNQNLFDGLLAQMTNSSSTSSSSSAQAAFNEPTGAATTADPLPSRQTPLTLLQKGLNDNGVSMERLQIAASDRPKLEEVLVNSGYGAEDAKQILDKSANSDGSINLGTVFALLPRYTPEQGPQFFIKATDKPLLSQVLKGLGISTEDVNSFMEGLEQVGDRLRVTGLPSLLAKAGKDSGNQSGQVDRSVLSDLLGKMGLATDEINTLLAKAYDGEGRANPKAVLALLQAAANRQDHAVADAMKDLAQRIKVVPRGQQKPLDADRMRAQFIKAVESVESGLSARSGEFDKELTQALTALSKGQGEGKLNELIPRLVKSELGGQASELGQGSAQAAISRGGEAASSGSQAGLAGGNSRQGGGESQTQAGGRQTLATAGSQTQTDSSFGVAMGRAGQMAGADQASGPRGVLPAYVVRQVGLAMTQMVARDQTTLRLDLKPPSLGELNLELSVKDGVVTAKLVAENVAAKQALESGMDQLKQDLANQGLKLSHVEITVNPDAERRQAQAQAGDNGRGSGGSRSGSGSGGQDLPGSDEDVTSVAGFLAGTAGVRISVFA